MKNKEKQKIYNRTIRNERRRNRVNCNCGRETYGFGVFCRSCCKKGINNPGWKGGKWKVQKKAALIRDNYTCVICGLCEKDIMEVDHIIPKKLRPDLKSELSNLMTICPNCHRRKTNRELKNGLRFGLW